MLSGKQKPLTVLVLVIVAEVAGVAGVAGVAEREREREFDCFWCWLLRERKEDIGVSTRAGSEIGGEVHVSRGVTGRRKRACCRG